jgi:tetratricopeptide (TPR) repeat protein
VTYAEPDRRRVLRARAFLARGRAALAQGDPRKAALELLIAASLDPKAAPTFVALGDVYGRGGKLWDARKAYDRAIELDPGAAEAWSGRGAVWARQGNREKALGDLGKAIELDPEGTGPLLRRAVLRLHAGELGPAHTDASEAIRRQPEEAQAWVLRGTIRTSQGQPERALSDLERAIEIDPRAAEAHFRRGLALLKLGDTERAEAAFAVAVGLDGDYAGAVLESVRDSTTGEIRARAAVEQAREFLQKGNLAAAVTSFLVALQFVEEDPHILRSLGDAYAAMGRPDEAVAAYSRALAMDPDLVGALFARGFAHQQAGRLDEAEADYRAVLERQPDNALALNAIGNVHFARRRFEEAVAAYLKATEVDPGFARARFNRGLALEELGRREEAFAVYESALILEPENTEILVRLGTVAFSLKKHDRARRAFHLAAELAPGDALARYNLGLTLEFGTDGERYGEGAALGEAEAAYRRVLGLDPRNGGAALNLGVLLLKSGRGREAVGLLQRAVALQPESLEAHYHLGLALEHGEDGARGSEGALWGEAVSAYDAALAIDDSHLPSRLNRAIARIRLGRNEEARDDLLRLKGQRPGDREVLYNLALVLGRLGDRDGAARSLQEYLQKGGDDAAADALRRSWE